MQLTIGQKLLFLAMNPAKPYYLIDSSKLQYALPGAILMDLLFLDIISIEDKIIELKKTPGKIKQPYQDVIDKIESFKKTKKLKRVLSKLGFSSKKYRHKFLEDLEEKALIKVENKQFLFIKYKRAYVINKDFRESIINEIKSAVENRKALSKSDICLTSIIYSTKSEKVFVKGFKEKKEFRKLLKNYVEDEEIGKVVGKLMSEMQAVIAASTAAATTAAIAASN